MQNIGILEKFSFKDKVLIGLLLLYTAIHFLYSGIYTPFFRPNASTYFEELSYLREHWFEGKEMVSPKGYGPLFFLLSIPVLYIGNSAFSFYLQLINHIFGIGAFYFLYLCCLRDNTDNMTKLFFAVIYFNFAPYLEIITMGNCEMWEFFLISMSLFFLLKDNGRSWNKWVVGTGVSIGLAAMLKLLPMIFLFYLFFRSYRAFIIAFVTVFIVLLTGEVVLGGEVGFKYVFDVFYKATSWRQRDWENISLPGFLLKMNYIFKLDFISDGLAWLLGKICQFSALSGFVYYVLRYDNTYNKTLIEYAVLSVFMMFLPPHSAHDYAVLTLPFYCIMFALLYRGIIKVDFVNVSLYLLSYLMVGLFLPMRLYYYTIPWGALHNYFGNTLYFENDYGFFYTYYGIPTIGMAIAVILSLKLIIENKMLFPRTSG